MCGISCGSHEWSNGKCKKCGYQCHHQIDEDSSCEICRLYLSKELAEYNVHNGIYAGSYVKEGSVNLQEYYLQYVWDNNTSSWIKGKYYLVILKIYQPTQFGGDYAYTVSGAVFTADIKTFAVNPTLLEGDGKYYVSLAQYTLDGKLIASQENYISNDCQNLEGRLPNF